MSSINYGFPIVIHKITKRQNLISPQVAIFEDIVWFYLLEPRLSSLDTPRFKDKN